MQSIHKFAIDIPFKYFKSGQYFCDIGWKHKNITNCGDYEIIIVIKGKIYISIGGKEISVGKEEALFIPAYTNHFGIKNSPRGTTYYWFHFFSEDLVEEKRMNVTLKTILNSYDENKNIIYLPQKVKLNHFEKAVLLSRQILDISNSNMYPNNTADYFITSLAIEIAKQYKQQIIYKRNIKESSKFEELTNWIRIHVYEKMTVDRIAKEFAFSKDYLTRLLKKSVGMSTIKYINYLKVKKAKELLLTTKYSVKKISCILNFSSEKYFLRLFKQLENLTPTQYRNSYTKTYLNNIDVDPDIPLPKRIETVD